MLLILQLIFDQFNSENHASIRILNQQYSFLQLKMFFIYIFLFSIFLYYTRFFLGYFVAMGDTMKINVVTKPWDVLEKAWRKFEPSSMKPNNGTYVLGI